jgi:hypothetical protein
MFSSNAKRYNAFGRDKSVATADTAERESDHGKYGHGNQHQGGTK